MKLNKNIIEIKLAKAGINKSTLAERSGLSRQSVSTVLCRGTCHVTTAAKLAAALGVDVEEIVSQEG